VIPAGDVVLKLNAPHHFEAEYEADALDLWAGNGAVKLIARNDVNRAFLIERCSPGTYLADVNGGQVEVVQSLLQTLHVKAAGIESRQMATSAYFLLPYVPKIALHTYVQLLHVASRDSRSQR
jgi:hypothetical protein